MERAADSIRGVSPSATGCVKEGLRTYSETLQRASALERAIEECR